MAASGYYRQTELFSTYLIESEDEIDFAELDLRAHDLTPDLNAIQPNRDVSIELDYLGVAGEADFLFSFKRAWDDRESDLLDYLDEVQKTIENGLPVIVAERQTLSIIPV